ncbi:hypothetical protein J6590_062999 [Homalodisca vitripennis]|nr:hypothetical protein J6590_062999 [Homalodisca vitripennis]
MGVFDNEIERWELEACCAVNKQAERPTDLSRLGHCPYPLPSTAIKLPYARPVTFGAFNSGDATLVLPCPAAVSNSKTAKKKASVFVTVLLCLVLIS